MSTQNKLTYRDAGVDIDTGNRLVHDIGASVERTRRPEVIGGLGGFGALFELPPGRYRHPVLVSGTDGVGTKLRLAVQAGRCQGLGIDLVAMCANDVVVQGAEPLFFLDYYATGRLDRELAASVIAGIAEGCVQAGAALVGGETAELPGMYADGDFDLAGFCVGVVEKDAILDATRVRPGDRVIGLPSSGPHANGYSLIRKILETSGHRLDQPLGDATLGDALLAPTHIYVKPLLALLARQPVRSMAHITGGGLIENVPRALPPGCAVRIDTGAWQRPPVFDWLRREGGLDDEELYRTFNCGIGMVLIVPADATDAVIAELDTHGAGPALCIGEVVAHREDTPVLELI